MDLSDLYLNSNPKLCKWSPDGRYLTNVSKSKLIIREANTLQVLQFFTCLDEIQELSWSFDSEYILCGLYKRGIVQVWSLEHPEWTCRIDEGIGGLTFASFSPDSRHIITISGFQIRLTIWSLLNRTNIYLRFPKYSNQGLAFSHNKKFMAVAERKECKDFVSIVSCQNWEIITQFKVETNDLVDLVWTPDDLAVCVWDSILEYRLLVYSPSDGRCLQRYEAYENALGIKKVSWSPMGQFLCIGSFDQKARVLSSTSWKVISELSHNNIIHPANHAVYREVPQNQGDPLATKYSLEEGVVSIPVVKPLMDKPNPKIGVGWIQWSFDDKYFASRNDNIPNVIWIYDVSKLVLLAVLIQKEAIRSARWDPKHARLLLCIGSEMIYLWTPTGCSSVRVSANFNVINITWNESGTAAILADKSKIGVCYFPQDS